MIKFKVFKFYFKIYKAKQWDKKPCITMGKYNPFLKGYTIAIYL